MALNSDLKPYIIKDNYFGAVLKHPLVYFIPYHQHFDELINEQYEHKLKAINSSILTKNYNQYIWLHERPYRFDALKTIASKMQPKEYWSLFSHVWSDYEFVSSQVNVMEMLKLHPNPELMMCDGDKQVYDNLPDRVKIYRGYFKNNLRGFSWTLCYHTAKWFALRFNQASARKGGSYSSNLKVVVGSVNKSDIIAYISKRSEKEIIVHPSKVHISNNNYCINIDKRYSEQYKEALAISKQNMQYSSDIHGIDHWLKVERNAVLLCKLNPDADRKVCRYFAIFHDCCRTDDDHDEYHGFRASLTLKNNKRLLTNLTSKQKEKLLYAIEHHNGGITSDDQTIGTCWDADRFDLMRVGIIPDPKFISTQTAKDNIFNI